MSFSKVGSIVTFVKLFSHKWNKLCLLSSSLVAWIAYSIWHLVAGCPVRGSNTDAVGLSVPSRGAPKPKQLPVKSVPFLFPGVKAAGSWC